MQARQWRSGASSNNADAAVASSTSARATRAHARRLPLQHRNLGGIARNNATGTWLTRRRPAPKQKQIEHASRRRGRVVGVAHGTPTSNKRYLFPDAFEEWLDEVIKATKQAEAEYERAMKLSSIVHG